MVRKKSYGEYQRLTLVDRYGVWLHRKKLRRYAGSFEGKRVGDFGCGYRATVSRWALPQVEDLILVDVALCDELKNEPKVTAIEGKIPSILETIPDDSLDIVICTNVLEHLPIGEPLIAVKHFYRMLVPDGVCIINLPSWRGKWFLEFSAYRLGLSPAYEMDDHKMYYDVSDLWPIVVSAGFSPGRIRCFSHKFGLSTFSASRK